MLFIVRHTVVLAQSNSPPMGANIMPIAKNIGSTVFGVRMGLESVNMVDTDGWMLQLTAMPSVAAVGTRCLIEVSRVSGVGADQY